MMDPIRKFKVTNPLDPQNPWFVHGYDEDSVFEELAEEWAGEDGPDYALVGTWTIEEEECAECGSVGDDVPTYTCHICNREGEES